MKRSDPKAEVTEDAQTHKAKIERELRLTKEYWLRTIQPYIKGRRLHPIELYVANYAYDNLRDAMEKATIWNATEEGRRFPVPTEALAGLDGEDFRPPEVLCADESLRPEVLAEIAAPLMNRGRAKLTPVEAVRTAHELLMAAQQYMETLPKKPDMAGNLSLAFRKVEFSGILRSNEENSGQLPLLPPVQTRRNEERPAGTPRLSKAAIKTAVKKFLKEHTPRITQEEYERGQVQNDRLAREGKLFRLGGGERMTYQEWRRREQEAMNDCLEYDRISLHDLCRLRWERFERNCQTRKSGALNRKQIKGHQRSTSGLSRKAARAR